MRLVIDAIACAESVGARPLSEAHLLCAVLERLQNDLGRYGGVRLVPSRRVRHHEPIRVPWSQQAEVLQRVRNLGLAPADWTYTRVGDELVILVAESIDRNRVAMSTVVDKRHGLGASGDVAPE